jgi:hypothetical protein
MDSVVFRAALRASAKVALTATLSSCGGAIQTGNADAPDAVVDASSTGDSTAPSDAFAGDAFAADVVAETPVDVVPDAGGCRPPPVDSLLPEPNHPGIAISDGLFDCCVTLLGAELRTDGQAPALTDAQAHDPTFLGCCAVTLYRLDDEPLDAGTKDLTTVAEAGVPKYPTLYAGCCEPLAPVSGFSLTCTPWGPPMPPAMPEVA